LLPWLVETLKSEDSSVERAGGAQGLSEVISALGKDSMRSMLQELIPLHAHPNSAVREGVLWLVVFLPPLQGASFGDELPLVLPAVLNGLADEEESVRDVAMRGSQVLISSQSKANHALILPTLSHHITHQEDRIRQASVQLLGEFMCVVGGSRLMGLAEIAGIKDEDDSDEEEEEKGNRRGSYMDEEDEDEESDEEDEEEGGSRRRKKKYDSAASFSSKLLATLSSILGEETLVDILSLVFLARSDVAIMVRQSAVHVWKATISNTPRVLKDLLPRLSSRILILLGSSYDHEREMGAKALGDLIHKMGEKMMALIIPHLVHKHHHHHHHLNHDENRPDYLKKYGDLEGEEEEEEETEEQRIMREGACLGLAQVLMHSTRFQIKKHLDIFLPAVHQALIDRNPTVRASGAEAFLALHKNLDLGEAVEKVLTFLIDQICDLVEDESGIEEEYLTEEDEEDEDDDEKEEDDHPSGMYAPRNESQDLQAALDGLGRVIGYKPRESLDFIFPLLLPEASDSKEAESKSKKKPVMSLLTSSLMLHPAYCKILSVCVNDGCNALNSNHVSSLISLLVIALVSVNDL
jgi:hypothetical protein